MTAPAGPGRVGVGWRMGNRGDTMHTRQRNIAGEIARLEAALRRERDALRGALDPRSRQALRLNLAVAHEELGALYRRLHALGAADDLVIGTPLSVVERAAGDDGPGGA